MDHFRTFGNIHGAVMKRGYMLTISEADRADSECGSLMNELAANY